MADVYKYEDVSILMLKMKDKSSCRVQAFSNFMSKYLNAANECHGTLLFSKTTASGPSYNELDTDNRDPVIHLQPKSKIPYSIIIRHYVMIPRKEFEDFSVHFFSRFTVLIM